MADDELTTIDGDDPWNLDDDPATGDDESMSAAGATAGQAGAEAEEAPSADGETRGRPIRSMPTFIAGVACIATGLAAGIADLSGLSVAQSASITFLTAAVVILAALIWQSRPR